MNADAWSVLSIVCFAAAAAFGAVAVACFIMYRIPETLRFVSGRARGAGVKDVWAHSRAGSENTEKFAFFQHRQSASGSIGVETARGTERQVRTGDLGEKAAAVAVGEATTLLWDGGGGRPGTVAPTGAGDEVDSMAEKAAGFRIVRSETVVHTV